ncbi:hypothetical protein BCR33DRAFT_788675 [Rhizoclosmatium globosum]|uniref:Fatty acid desaturase domain-containing protein n=1 Tax=Rhizoclosmatium globosum TaxID=329046 RepID=A0A1Y2BVZ5_9FUNG|nr:hypothetical protein BCR33DRAFT_788675 [Rhizoclosmatium globosum]|eukprot:ORY38817.1 hypothetical protein BCR33DRAFT_788675 [Rhizoclosmatium globosum]
MAVLQRRRLPTITRRKLSSFWLMNHQFILPQFVDLSSQSAPEKGAPKLTVGALRKSLPAHVFEKSLAQSMWYFIVDFTVIFSCLRFYTDDMSWPVYIVYANVLGLFMWCLFVVGHDCGHGTFSDSKLINAVLGHVSHGFILVPFWPWAKSHATHHAFHQHKHKDKSHGWYDVNDEGIEKVMKNQPFFIPFLYFFVYLLAGYPDGSHFYPFSPLFNTARDSIMAAVSGLVCVGFFTAFIQIWGWNKFVWIYGVPWLIYNFWLYKVTYLQHHGEGTIVYSEETWDYLTGGLQTIDRVYDTNTGALDSVMHNITNGHVVHHLFSTSIPHYKLIDATNVIVPQLGDKYRLVKGFPFMELIRHHWYNARPFLVKRTGFWEFISQEQYYKEQKASVTPSN